MDIKNIIKELAHVELFKNLTEKEIEEMLSKIKYNIFTYEKDEYVDFSGTEVYGLNMILIGKISTEMIKSNGELKKIEVLEQHSMLATGFIFGKKNFYPVNLVTLEKTIILEIPKEELLKLLSSEKRILERFLADISGKVEILTSKIWGSFQNKTIKEKLNHFILKNEKDGIFELNMSIKSISEQFEVSRPSLSREISNYIKNGIIEKIGNKKYRVLDQDFIEE